MSIAELRASQRIHGFLVDRVEQIGELRSTAVQCTHEKTGARLVHLLNEDPNNLFCIAFRTPVFDNTGVPHILEHSVLSGSRKFPLKDPFKELLKGSLQTFLNALTYPDKTVYPVASQVEADFFNLVDVYCDAVFHPLLTETTFFQEGWHFDLDRPDAEVDIRGIVYNEMKGVFSDFRSHVSRRTLSELFPDTTYFYESGGDPERIPDLTYDNFKAFHARYYHPSNSFTFLYGNIPTATTLEFLQRKYLGAFEKGEVDSVVRPQAPWKKARRVDIPAPSSREDDGTSSIIVCWLFGDTTDPVTVLLGSILSRYLLGTESSPLRRALIDSGLGEDLDDMSGYDADLVNGIFCAGLRRTRRQHAAAIEQLVLDTLRTEVARGLDEQLLEGSVRQTEFHLREISDSGHFPHNLMLAERCLRSWLYGGDPLAHLRFEGPLEAIKQQRHNRTAFFADAIRTHLLDNPHRLLSVITASSAMGEALGKLTEKQARHLTESFGPEERERCLRLTARLRESQKEPPSPEALASLPRLDKADLPRKNRTVPTEPGSVAGARLFAHPLFTSDIVYLDIGFDLMVVPRELLMYFPLYAELITRCGAAGSSFEEMAKRVSLSTGAIGCSKICSVVADDGERFVCPALFHGKALAGRFDDMIGIFRDLFLEPDLGDTKLIKDTLVEMRNDFNAAVIRNGHIFAAHAAAAQLCRTRYLTEFLDGITQLRFLDALVKSNDVETVARELERLHALLVNSAGCFVSLTAEEPAKFMNSVESLIGQLNAEARPEAAVSFSPRHPTTPLAVEISSSVNFAAKVWDLASLDANRLGQLEVLAKNLSTGYLWEKVRVEGGAYGGRASVSSAHPVFVCGSYRDPNISKTLVHFEKALAHVAAGLADDEIDQSIIGTIGQIDHPRAPHSDGLAETIARVCGQSPGYRQAVRESVLSTTSSSLAASAQQLLDQPRSAVAVFGSASAIDGAGEEGLSFAREALLPGD